MLDQFRVSLGDWLWAMLNWPTPDWREQLDLFVEHTRNYGLVIEPDTIRRIHDLVEARVNGTGPFAALGPYAGPQPAGTGTIQLAMSVAVDDGTRTDATVALDSGRSPIMKDGLEVAGPGPEVTASYKAKVQKALETLDSRVGNWWKANGVEGEVRSRAAAFWQFGYYSRMEANDQPVIYVDQNFTAGQTAQAILAEVASGWFADSIGAFYKKHRFARTGNIEEFRAWQTRATGEAARFASILAELYVNSIASIGPAGDLIVTIEDVADNGLSWDQLLSVLPLLSFLPIGAIIFKLGKRQITIPKQLAREFENLNSEQRKVLLLQAAAAKTDEEAAAIIKRGVAAEAKGPRHHIATNKNTKSALRGGPWTPRFQKIFDRAGMSLKDAENIVHIPGHLGPHPEGYHQEIFRRLTSVTKEKRGVAYKEALVAELKTIAEEAGTAGTKLNTLLTQ